MHAIGLVFTLVILAFSQASYAQTHPTCLSADSDIDGDGWGYESGRSCIVDDTSTGSSVCEDLDGDGWGWNGTNTCVVTSAPVVSIQSGTDGVRTQCTDTDGDGFGWDGIETCTVSSVTPIVTIQSNPSSVRTECIDTDGDGFGWDGIETCTVQAATPVVTVQSDAPSVRTDCIDTDGDGFGWDGIETCTVSVAQVVTTQSGTTSSPAAVCIDTDGDGYGHDGTSSCVVELFAGVTDVVLMMGQSNALGEDTDVNLGSVDAIDDNILVWTQFDGWQVANLCTQIWQKGWFPWRGGVCSNHPAFQIAKSIVAADPGRKVAVIPTGYAGKPISWWDSGALAYELAKAHTEAALAALPGKSKVDLVAWSQGEADDGIEDVWYNKLNNLISRLRSESWVDRPGTVFISQETKDSSVNSKLPLFDSDSDPLTNWIRASDLPTKDGVHWSASALRSLGSRYAAKYLSVAN